MLIMLSSRGVGREIMFFFSFRYFESNLKDGSQEFKAHFIVGMLVYDII